MKTPHSMMLCAAVLILTQAGCTTTAKPPVPNNRVLMLLGPGFNRQEFSAPYKMLGEAGYKVDIAGIQRGPVLCNPDKPANTDPIANLSLDEVRVADYVGLVIPGGYSPGNLEKHEQSIDICKKFHDAHKPIAAICHGPRLLIRAGLMTDRTGTCLYTVPNELADIWRSGDGIGHYVDAPVVVDGPFTTSRYPNDAKPFAAEAIRQFAAAGGLPVQATTQPTPMPTTQAVPTVFLRVEKGFADHTLAALDAALRLKGERVAIVSSKPGWIVGKEGMPVLAAAIDATQTGALPVYRISAGGVEGDVPSDLRHAADLANSGPTAPPFDAAIALREGFDGRVVEAMRSTLMARGLNVALVAEHPGEMRDLDGMRFTATAGYDQPLPLTPHPLIIAPGGLWPEKDDSARQSKQPDWINQQADRDAARLQWIMSRYNSGGTLITFGFDSWRLGRQKTFAGLKFASSDQTVWAFPVGGGKYSPDVAVRSGDHIISAKGIEGFAALIGMLGSPNP